MDKALTLQQAADLLGLSYQTVFARRHEIGFRLEGCRTWRVWPSRLEEITKPRYNVTRIASAGNNRSVICQSDYVTASGMSISARQAAKELDTLLAQRTKKQRRSTKTA